MWVKALTQGESPGRGSSLLPGSPALGWVLRCPWSKGAQQQCSCSGLHRCVGNGQTLAEATDC